MHIFNQKNKVHLIIGTKDITFPDSEKEVLHRISFEEIRKVSIIHRYAPDKELFIWLKIAVQDQHQDHLVQISALDEPLEEIFAILREELSGKCKLVLPKDTFLHTLRTRHKTHKLSFLLVCILLLGMFGLHKFYPPELGDLKVDSLKTKSLKTTGLCSANVIIAYPSSEKDKLKVNSYCGVLHTWRLSKTKQIPRIHLETEFSDLSVRDYLVSTAEKIKTEKLEEALIEIEKAMYLAPKDERVHTLLSKIYTLQGKDIKAFEVAKKALALNESSSNAHYNIALLYLKKEAIEEAYPHLKRSVELEPNAEVYIRLAQIEKQLDLQNEALKHYENSLVLDPENASVWTEVGLSYWKKKEFLKTENALKKAYTLFPDNAGYFLNYYEVTLITASDLNSSEHQHFLAMNKNDTKSVLTYEMLKIIELSIKNLDTQNAEQQWIQKFDGQALNWSFNEIRYWLDESDLDIDHKQKVQATLGFFIGYQQAYKIKLPFSHTTGLPQ